MNDANRQILEGIEEVKTRLDDGKQRFEAIDERFDEVHDAWSDRFKEVLRERNRLTVILILSLIAMAFSIGYAWNSGNALDDQIDTNQAVVCSQARSTAAAFRESLPGESRAHFLRRMYAQRETLMAVDGLDCADVDGFFNFERQRQRALDELNRILGRVTPAAPEERTSDDQSSTASNLIAGDGNTGNGPSGELAPPDGPNTPSSPNQPETPTEPPPAQPKPPDPVDPKPTEPTDPPPASEPPAQQSQGILDPTLDLATGIVCQVNVAGIRVCTR